MDEKKEIKILVADDSAFMRQFVIGYLHEGGFFNIIEAGNGKIAVDLFEAEKPDIILLDLIMPVQDGAAVLDKLVTKGAKVIIVSAMGQKKIVERMIKAGAKDYLVKPFFSAKEIKNKIEEILNKN